MSKIWIVAAQSSCAKILETETPLGALREVELLEHPAARAHQRDLMSDRPGRSFDSGGEGRNAMESEVEPKHHEAMVFAKQIAARLESGRIAGDFQELVLVAGPEFLGLLRHSLSDATKQHISKTIDKNLVHMDAETIREHLI